MKKNNKDYVVENYNLNSDGKCELDAKNKETVKIDISYSRLDKDIDKVAEEKRKVDVNVFLGQLFNTVEIVKNAKNVINPDLDYAVKFTPELLKKMREHDVQFLKDKLTGDLLPDLYDYTEKGIGGKIRLEIKGQPTGQDIANLSNSVNNLIEQQRYDALVEEIQKLHITVKHIERGQDNDRFAEVLAGRKHLIDALNYQGTEEEKKKLIFDAIAMLRKGRELIERTLIDKLDALENVPEKKIHRLWKCFSRPDYFDSQTRQYEDIQEYFQYYYMSIQPMAYAYTYLNQPQLVERLLEDSQNIFDHKNVKNLSSVELLLPDIQFGETWYKNPKFYEERLLTAYISKDEQKDLIIFVKGSELLEEFDYGTEEKK